jgi:hypothetical protein
VGDGGLDGFGDLFIEIGTLGVVFLERVDIERGVAGLAVA